MVEVEGDGDLGSATAQVLRFLSLDVDATGWPAVGERDPVIGDAQRALPGLRPCGFHSPYEAAVWTVLSQRIRVVQAARLRSDLTLQLGDAGALPSPQVLAGATCSCRAASPSTCEPLPGRPWTACSTARCCGSWIPRRRSGACSR